METHDQPRIHDTIFGIHAVTEALKAGTRMDKILLRNGIAAEVRSDIMDRAKKADVQVQFVPPEKIQKMCPRGANHQGVLAFLSLVEYTEVEDVVMAAFDKGTPPLLILLDKVSDVRNFAAIARTAECVGAHGIIIPKAGAARINADAMKISSGALNYLPVSRVENLADTIMLLQQYGVKVYACTEKSKTSVFEANLAGPVCLLFGSEDEGITPRLLKMCDDKISIPMAGNIESLNVSVAAGMMMLEVIRQRKPIKE